MAIRVELWMDGRLEGGTEAWWDDMEIALPDNRTEKYPLLSQVDPYADAIFEQTEIEELVVELRALMLEHSSEGLGPLVSKLIELCVAALAAGNAQLKFLGD